MTSAEANARPAFAHSLRTNSFMPPHRSGGPREATDFAAIVFISSKKFHADATPQSQGNGIDGGQAPLQFLSVVAAKTVQHHKQVDVALRTSFPSGL